MTDDRSLSLKCIYFHFRWHRITFWRSMCANCKLRAWQNKQRENLFLFALLEIICKPSGPTDSQYQYQYQLQLQFQLVSGQIRICEYDIYLCMHTHTLTHTCTSHGAALGAAAVSQENLPGINFSADPLGAQPNQRLRQRTGLVSCAQKGFRPQPDRGA